MQHYKTLRLILGDQLNVEHSWFKSKDQNVLNLVLELHQEQYYVKHHIQKICAFFKAMENFSNALKQSGHKVEYLTLDDTAEYATLCDCLIALCKQYQCSEVHIQQPDEYRLQQQLLLFQKDVKQQLNIEVTFFDSEHFILPKDDIPKYFTKDKHVRMENFYRAMRKRFNILMQESGPVGGQWNFDSDNRKHFKKNDLASIPQPLMFANDVSLIIGRLQRHNIPTLGKIEATLLWPCNRAQSRKLLQYFCHYCLPSFGRFQDAMTEQSKHAWSLYHSRISFALNAKMLHPLEVIETAIGHYKQAGSSVDIAQVEGFTRQVLGWREYVRGMYWINMPDIANTNALQAKRPLPKWFWDGQTNMNCMSKAVTQSLDYAYAHHIQRLMVTGNFALLTGLHPDEVEQWYLGIYIDAIEWVELPNTRGMALSADGGLIATKPYASSGNYINKMSDYCKDCHYSVKAKTGSKACPFNSLYWHFLDEHKDKFKKNSRMALPYKTWQRMEAAQKTSILNHATELLKNLDDL